MPTVQEIHLQAQTPTTMAAWTERPPSIPLAQVDVEPTKYPRHFMSSVIKPRNQSRLSQVSFSSLPKPSMSFKLGLGDHRTSNSISLRIWAELLMDELTKALAPGESNAGDERHAAKLRVLLLIKSYENVLESCRKEMNHLEMMRLEQGGDIESNGVEAGEVDEDREDEDESDDERMYHAQEAMTILENWLEALTKVYEENFGKD
jgi:hypothetical protein